jgi:exodeoxyribonuclease VII large subunit
MVARAIFNSNIPIVSGIGHEIDFTIADFVADHRAPTPSAAAELISPDSIEWLNHLLHLQMRLAANIRNILSHFKLLLANIEKRLPHPQRRLQDQAQHLDRLEQQLLLAHRHILRHCTANLNQLFSKLMRYIPLHTTQAFLLQCTNLEQRIKTTMHYYLNTQQRHLENLLRALDGVSPLHTLNRGYSVALKNKKVITSIDQVRLGDTISVQLAQGLLECLVQKKIELD